MGEDLVNRPYLQCFAGIKGSGGENKLGSLAVPGESGEKVGAAKFRGDAYPDKGAAESRSFRSKTNITGQGDRKTKAVRWPIDGCDDGFRVLYKGPWQVQ